MFWGRLGGGGGYGVVVVGGVGCDVGVGGGGGGGIVFEVVLEVVEDGGVVYLGVLGWKKDWMDDC